MFPEPVVFGLASSPKLGSLVEFIPSINMASQADLIACARSWSVISLSLPRGVAMSFVMPFMSSSIPFASSRAKSS